MLRCQIFANRFYVVIPWLLLFTIKKWSKDLLGHATRKGAMNEIEVH